MDRHPKYMAVQAAAFGVGVVFVVLGIFGFIPGVTTGLQHLQWAGLPAHGAPAELVGVFAVSGLHNALHLATGIVGVLFARAYTAARGYLLAAGLGYLGLWILGLIIDDAGPLNILPVSAANNWFNLGAGLLLLLLGVTLGGQHDPTRPRHRMSSRVRAVNAPAPE